MNRQDPLIGKVDQDSFEMLSEEQGWCEVSFIVLDAETGKLSKPFKGWYCDAFRKLMKGYKVSNWDRRFHPRTHQSLDYVVTLYREGKLKKRNE